MGESFLDAFHSRNGVKGSLAVAVKKSHRPNTFRTDRRALTIINCINEASGRPWDKADSQSQALATLAQTLTTAATFRHARVCPNGISMNMLDKVRAVGVWMVRACWDMEWRMRLVMKSLHEDNPKIQPGPEVDWSETLPRIISTLRLDRWTQITPNKIVLPGCAENSRAIALIMIFCGTRFEDLTYMRHEQLIRTDAYFEFVARIKTRTTLTRIRVHRLTEGNSLCPYRALEAVVRQEIAKHTQRHHRGPLSGPVWTGPDGAPWSAKHIAHAASRMLRLAEVSWYHRPYKLKKLSASALIAAGVDRVDVAKFIRHSPTSGNLDRFYVDDDLGRGVASRLEQITSAI